MSLFVGRFDRSVDGKGRVILPSRLRPYFDSTASTGGFLAPHEDGCIALWANEEFTKESNRQHLREEDGVAARHEVREWFSKVSEIKLDIQGRMAVPGDLKSYAGLDTEVLFVGVHDRVELWSRERWDHRFELQSGAAS
ncbi:MAG: division/cell wall cluster transcriptional repressor MraZ [Acidimicrobiales bacterium]